MTGMGSNNLGVFRISFWLHDGRLRSTVEWSIGGTPKFKFGDAAHIFEEPRKMAKNSTKEQKTEEEIS